MFRYILIIIVVVSSVSCNEKNTWSKFDKYPDSGEITAFEFENGNAYERVYFLQKEYPYNGVIKHYESIVQNPWKPCQPINDWSGYLDSSGNETAYVHRIIRHWANFDNSRLLLLAISYRSLGTKILSKPTSDNQTIILVEYAESDMKASLKRIELTCE